MSSNRCPCCKQRIPGTKPVRVCQKCNLPIERHNKWHFNKRGRIVHRNCKNPDSYTEEVTA